jgi:hypothetical protein
MLDLNSVSALFDVQEVFFTVLEHPVSYVEFIGTVLGLISVFLAARANIFTWPTGIANAIFLHVDLLPDPPLLGHVPADVLLRDGRLRLVYLEIQGRARTERDPDTQQHKQTLARCSYRWSSTNHRYFDITDPFAATADLRKTGIISIHRHICRRFQRAGRDLARAPDI